MQLVLELVHDTFHTFKFFRETHNNSLFSSNLRIMMEYNQFYVTNVRFL